MRLIPGGSRGIYERARAKALPGQRMEDAGLRTACKLVPLPEARQLILVLYSAIVAIGQEDGSEDQRSSSLLLSHKQNM